MILDRLENFGQYASVHPNFRTAARFLETIELEHLSVGRVEIDGDRVYGILSERALTGPNPTWEAHVRYADVQIVLTGAETFGWAARGRDADDRGYDAQADFLPCGGAGGQNISLTEGQFAVFLPREPHRPNNPAPGAAFSRKLILKIRMDE